MSGWSLAIAPEVEDPSDPDEPPRAAADAYQILEDRTSKRGADRGLLANDADRDGDAPTVKLVAGPAKGAPTLNPNGSFADKPKRNVRGTVVCADEVIDAAGNTDSATAAITVLSRPDSGGVDRSGAA